MTNRIDRLVQRQLVARRTDPHDGRGVLVVMTDAGHSRMDAATTLLLVEEAAWLAGLSPADQERLRLLRKLAVEFDDLTPLPACRESGAAGIGEVVDLAMVKP